MVSELSLSEQNTHVETSYILLRDRDRRIIIPPQGYGQTEFLAFVLTVVEDIVQLEAKTYK